MTKREVYTAILEGKVNDEVLAEVKGYIEALDKANANRKTKKSAEQALVDEKVLAVLTTEPQKAKAITEAIKAADTETDITSQKVTAACARLAAEGKVVITEERKGSRITNSYSLAVSED